MKRNDYIRDADNDLLFIDGDFVSGDAQVQQAECILRAGKGEIRQYPEIGLNIIRYLGSNLDSTILNNLIVNALKLDGLLGKEVSVERTNKNFKIIFKV